MSAYFKSGNGLIETSKIAKISSQDHSERVEELAISLHMLIQKFNPLQGNGFDGGNLGHVGHADKNDEVLNQLSGLNKAVGEIRVAVDTLLIESRKSVIDMVDEVKVDVASIKRELQAQREEVPEVIECKAERTSPEEEESESTEMLGSRKQRKKLKAMTVYM